MVINWDVEFIDDCHDTLFVVVITNSTTRLYLKIFLGTTNHLWKIYTLYTIKNGKKIIKGAGALLIVAVLILSTNAALANTEKSKENQNNPNDGPVPIVKKTIVWDNGAPS